MGFFHYQPENIAQEDLSISDKITTSTSGGMIISVTALILALGIAAKALALITGINAIKLILYMEIFWVPYYATLDTLNNVFRGTPDAFMGFILIFTTIMLFVFAYDLYEMTGDEATT